MKTKHDEEVKLKTVEEKKVRDEKFNKLDELGKIQFLLDEKQAEIQKTVDERLKV